jgi:hypothetical protein
MRFASLPEIGGVLFLSLIAAGSVCAQPVDPIDALLRQSQAQAQGKAVAVAPEDEEAAEAAGRPLVPDTDPTPGLPRGPIPYSAASAAAPHLTAPVTVEQSGLSPDAPPTVRDLAYESRVRSSFASAQGFQGPLDGSFVLSAGGQDLYSFELVDRARGGELEGAWRDLRKPGTLGFIDEISRSTGGDLTLRFGDASATLRGGGVQWSGQIQDGGRSQTATLRRVAK